MSLAHTGRIAVGGGHGFIGHRLCTTLAGAGRWPVAFGREGAPEVECDALVWAGGRRSDAVDEMTEAHLAAPLRALLALRPRRVVYLSSAEVYGKIAAPFHEDDIAAPETVYGNAKQAGEVTLGAACEALGAALVVLRPTVVYGPGQPPTMLLPAALAALRAGTPFPATEGLQTRDFLHVDDLAALVLRCLDSDAPAGVYNAGSGAETRVCDALQLLADAVGPHTRELLQLGALPTRPGEAMRYAVDISRASRRLDWYPAVPLADGLQRLAAHQ